MSQFSSPIGLRVGQKNLWKFFEPVNYNFLSLYLKLKYFLIVRKRLLIYCKIFKIKSYVAIYACYFKYVGFSKYEKSN